MVETADRYGADSPEVLSLTLIQDYVPVGEALVGRGRALPELARRELAEAEADPFLRAILEAPLDDEPETEEERQAVAEAYEDIAAGRVYSMDELKRLLLGGEEDQESP